MIDGKNMIVNRMIGRIDLTQNLYHMIKKRDDNNREQAISDYYGKSIVIKLQQ